MFNKQILKFQKNRRVDPRVDIVVTLCFPIRVQQGLKPQKIVLYLYFLGKNCVFFKQTLTTVEVLLKIFQKIEHRKKPGLPMSHVITAVWVLYMCHGTKNQKKGNQKKSVRGSVVCCHQFVNFSWLITSTTQRIV